MRRRRRRKDGVRVKAMPAEQSNTTTKVESLKNEC
jgi:hypothetical protein